MAVDENAWKGRTIGADKKPCDESNPNSGSGGNRPVNNGSGNVPESDQEYNIVDSGTRMEIDKPSEESNPPSTTPQLISQVVTNQIHSSQKLAVAETNSSLFISDLSSKCHSASDTFQITNNISQIAMDRNGDGRHPAVYGERAQLPVFSRVNIQNPIHVTKLNDYQTSIQESKMNAMSPSLFFDRKSSDDEFFYLYYMSDTGIITRMRGSYASRRLLDEHAVYFPFPVNQQTIEVPDTVNRMPPSCRFLDGGRVVYADGLGKLTCFLAERDFPFKWNHQMTFYLPLNSDNICVHFDVQHILNQRPGLPFIITDSRVKENFTEVILLATVKRKPQKVGKDIKSLVMLSKVYWLTIGKKDNEQLTRLVRQRIYECDGMVDYVSLDPQCNYLIFSSTVKPQFIYDSNKPINIARSLVRYIPNEYPFTFEQDSKTVAIKIQFSYFITENFLEVLFDNDFICVKYRGATVFRANLFSKVMPSKCTYNRENIFGENRATTNLVIRMVKEASNEWDHLLAKTILEIEPTSYFDHHFVHDATEDKSSKEAIISWFHGGSGEITQSIKMSDHAVYSGGPIHQSLCIADRNDAKLILFNSDKSFKDYATIENFIEIMNSIPNIRFSSCAPSGRYFVHVDANNKIYLYTWKRQSAEFRENQHVVGEKFVFDLGRYIEKYNEYPSEDKEIVCVLALEKLLIVATRIAFFITSDI